MDYLPVKLPSSKPGAPVESNALADFLSRTRIHERAARVHPSLVWYGIAGGAVLTLAGFIAIQVNPTAFTRSSFFLVGRGWLAGYLEILSMFGLPMLLLGLTALVINLYMLCRPVPSVGHWLCAAEVYGAVGVGAGWGVVVLVLALELVLWILLIALAMALVAAILGALASGS
jgi:hypothetical protein